jgi:hypothetical protein
MRTLALVLASFSLGAAASAVDIHKLKRTAVAYKERPVGNYFTTISDTCETRKLPEIDLNVPPAGGTVCMRPGVGHLQNVWGGNVQHCIGKKMFGALVIYRPFGSFTGLDTMQYTVRGGEEPWRTRTYEVEITVEAGEATAPGASSAPPESQKPGPMPECPPLVS